MKMKSATIQFSYLLGQGQRKHLLGPRNKKSVLMVPGILDEKLLEGVSDTLEVLQGEATSVALVSGAVRRNSDAVNGCREKTTGESKGKAHRRDLLIGAKSGMLTPHTTHLVEAQVLEPYSSPL